MHLLSDKWSHCLSGRAMRDLTSAHPDRWAKDQLNPTSLGIAVMKLGQSHSISTLSAVFTSFRTAHYLIYYSTYSHLNPWPHVTSHNVIIITHCLIMLTYWFTSCNALSHIIITHCLCSQFHTTAYCHPITYCPLKLKLFLLATQRSEIFSEHFYP